MGYFWRERLFGAGDGFGFGVVVVGTIVEF